MRTPQPGSWPGSKTRLMSVIHQHLPEHELFVSVFGGIGGDVLSHPPTAHEVMNDLNKDVIRFFRFIQGLHWREFIAAIAAFSPTRETWHWARSVLRSEEGCDWTRAVAFGVAVNLSGAAKDPTAPYASFNRCTKRWKGLAGRLAKVSFRLVGVEVTNLDCLDVIRRFDSPLTVFCVDPPYVLSTLSTDRIYRHEMDDSEHDALLWRLRAIRGKAIVFGYPSSLYDAVLGDWQQTVFTMPIDCSVVAMGQKRRQVTNVVWTNFTLFKESENVRSASQ